MPPELSVIIPVLDEAARLPALINALYEQRGITLDIVLGDGGSKDGSPAIGKRWGASVVYARTGRGAQMNAAAAVSQAPYLLFLHADSRLTRPDQLARALDALRRIPADGVHAAGHFPLCFERERHAYRWPYRFMEAKTALNRPGTFNGDQGLLISAAFFNSLGGFDERLPFLEDQRLAARIRASGRWITLPDALITSARRFEAEGLCRRCILMALIMGCENSGLHEFFAHAPEVYRAQSHTGLLRMSPFIESIHQCLRERPAIERRRAWFAVGRYVRDNAWQPFYLLDVLLGRASASTPYLNAFERRVRPHLEHPWIDVALSALTRLWVMGLLRVYFRFADRQR